MNAPAPVVREFPARSNAVTSIECTPSARGPIVKGLDAATHGPASRLTSYRTMPLVASHAAKLTTGDESSVHPPGSTVTTNGSGGVASTVNVHAADVRFPAGSVATAVTLRAPSGKLD